MSQPFIASIEPFPYNFAPYGWAMCQGQLLPIQQYAALFSLLGTYYGGNGTSNFALPNLQSRVAVGMGTGQGLSPYTIGEATGTESVTLLTSTMPAHTHLVTVVANGADIVADAQSPSGAVWGTDGSEMFYTAPGGTPAIMDQKGLNVTAQPTGGSQPHENRMPILALNYCIALQGVFPSRG